MATTSSMDRRIGWKRSLAVFFTALTALLAYAGAVGLAGGGTDFGPTVNARLPWHSPVLAGIGLALLVGLPMTVAAWLLPNNQRSDTAMISIFAGGWLIGWIAVQLAVIRTLNPLQAACVGVGAVLIGLGMSVRHELGSRTRPRP
ncbi:MULTISPECIES: hypothetical protein [unclassified Gordonia (in: high G+C Gram-positive bacteria)]|uniref:hypothetical protein n=1 Tax=unclassified Gordonia (in: high G+C Gram-positive bacteria) TaxID=2657482 RepID=UPI001115D20A|nr:MULTISPECIES: hypothetical protein [unclassified Gordonia (in: high G+C Gram-positive bacteria)]MCX2753637.1 hypothetical protein [Gordonia sp. 4N]